MKAKIILLGLLALGLAACEQQVGDAALIEGAWDLRTVAYDHTVYADLNGNTHYKEEPTTRNYESNAMVWLFYQGSISWWSYVQEEGFWCGYAGDWTKNYMVEGKGANMSIVETTRSIIPGEEDNLFAKQYYHVEKLTRDQMVLSSTDKMYVTDTGGTTDIQVTYTFQRENSLLEWLKKWSGIFN